MKDLRQDLDRALSTITVSLPPVEDVLRDGRRLRTRRRIAVLAGTLAIAVLAAGYPALAGRAVAPPALGAGHRHAARHDPVVTDVTATKGAVSGDIAQGTIGSAWWQVRVHRDDTPGALPGYICYQRTLSTSDGASGECGVGTAGAPGSEPAQLQAISAGGYETALGIVASDVAYLVLTFTDGQRLRLVPASVEGHRYVAWTAPASMTIKNLTAHLGGPGSGSGQTRTTIPFDRPGHLPVFGAWFQTG
jgi:hypothetical protein